MSKDPKCTCGVGVSIHQTTCPSVVAFYAREDALKPFKDKRCLGTCRVQTIGADSKVVTLHGEGCAVKAEADGFAAYQAKMAVAARAMSDARAVREKQATDATAGMAYSQPLSEHEQRAMHGERLFRRSEVLAVVLGVQEDLRRKGIHSAGLLAVDAVIRAIADME